MALLKSLPSLMSSNLMFFDYYQHSILSFLLVVAVYFATLLNVVVVLDVLHPFSSFDVLDP